jgi:hypothetical protein
VDATVISNQIMIRSRSRVTKADISLSLPCYYLDLGLKSCREVEIVPEVEQAVAQVQAEEALPLVVVQALEAAEVAVVVSHPENKAGLCPARHFCLSTLTHVFPAFLRRVNLLS